MALASVPGDLVLAADGRSFTYCEGVRRIAQRISLSFITPFGSNDYDTRDGFDWKDLLGGDRSEVERKAIIRAHLGRQGGVLSVLSVNEEIDKAARSAAYTYTVLVTGGETLAGGFAFPLAD